MPRRSISTRERVRLFDLHKGICHICGCKIDGTREAWEIEHVLPVAFGGEETDENRKLAHVKCHKTKTKQDIRQIRKSDRIRARHIGAKRSKWPKSRWKKKVSGEVVPRNE